MPDEFKICGCGATFTSAQSSGKFCFKCKLNGVRFNWVGGGSYGRQAFHDNTVGEVVAQTHRIAALSGVTASKVSTRAELV